jgi:DNA-binding MarR family transcriptional regulator
MKQYDGSMTSANRRDMGSPAASDLVRQLRTFNLETERYVQRMSHRHSMHRTDLAAIGLVMDRGGASPTDIAHGLNLSPSATTAMIDRLERAGHVRRERVESDRRSVRVEITDQALAVGSSMFGLLAAHMRPVLDSYDEDELAAMAALMQRINEAAHAAADEAVAEPSD